ncbi:MAG: hypothetical protein RIA65_01730, partial [Woeseia sp.]
MTAARYGLLVVLCSMLAVVAGPSAYAEDETSLKRPIVMVCAHGTVKSVMASEYFNKEARKRGLSFRATARGVDPDSEVPSEIARALAADGIDVSAFKPRKLMPDDASQSPLLIGIGVDLAGFSNDEGASIVQWSDIPPASVDFAASKAAMMVRI